MNHRYTKQYCILLAAVFAFILSFVFVLNTRHIVVAIVDLPPDIPTSASGYTPEGYSTIEGPCTCILSAGYYCAIYQCALDLPLPIPVVNWPGTKLEVWDKILEDYVLSLPVKAATRLSIAEGVANTIIQQATNLTDECPPYKRTREGTCLVTVGNWKDLPELVAFQTKTIVGNLLERSAFFNFLEAAGIIQNTGINTYDSQGANDLDAQIYQATGGIRVFPNSTLGGILTYFLNPLMNPHGQQAFVSNYLGQQIQQNTSATLQEAQAGSGWFSAEEVSQLAVDPVTGEATPYKYRITYPGGTLKTTIDNGIDFPNKAFASTDNIDLSQKLVMPIQGDDGVYRGGLAALRTLFNKQKGGIGLFEVGPSVPNPINPETIPSCTFDVSESSVTIPQGEQKVIQITPNLVNEATLQKVLITSTDEHIVMPSPVSIDNPAATFSVTLTTASTTSGMATIIIKGILEQKDADGKAYECNPVGTVKVTVSGACTITLGTQDNTGFAFDPSPKGTDSMSWNNVGAGITASSPLGETFNWIRQMVISITGNQGKTINIISSNEPLVASGTVSASSSATFGLTVHYPTISDTTIKVEVRDSADKLLCDATQTVTVGYRCSAFRCPPAGCYPPTCQDSTPGTTTPLHSCAILKSTGQYGPRTEYCDYYTGVRKSDTNNAYCVDTVPSPFSTCVQ